MKTQKIIQQINAKILKWASEFLVNSHFIRLPSSPSTLSVNDRYYFPVIIISGSSLSLLTTEKKIIMIKRVFFFLFDDCMECYSLATGALLICNLSMYIKILIIF